MPDIKAPDQNLPQQTPEDRTAWQFRRPTFAPWFIPDPPYRKQPDQRYNPLPDYDQVLWRQPRLQPLPSGIFTAQGGTYAVQMAAAGCGQGGIWRAQNNIAGYTVYVGSGVMPDFTQAPSAFSQSLPISVHLAPPGMGTLTYYVVVRKRDHYGLESQNQNPTTLTIDSSGNLILPAVNAPQGFKASQIGVGMVRVSASYGGLGVDQYPATHWKVWAATGTPPNPAVDTPVLVVKVTGNILAATFGPVAAGTYFVVIGLYRQTDLSLSDTATAAVVVTTAPAGVTPVPGGSH
jgi:hypothetical protein